MSGQTRHFGGLAAEDAVARRYEARGAAVLARRWRGEGGEIDLIFREGAALVFVEVKSSATRDRAADRLGPAQIARLRAAAAEYLAGEPAGQDSEARFDVALVDGSGRVEIIENALFD